jgi:hypothetical protein
MSTSPETREITLRHLTWLVRECWQTLVFSAGVFFLVALIALFFIQPRYTVALKVAAIPQQNEPGGLMSGMGGMSGLSTLLKGVGTDTEFRRYQIALTTVELGRRLMAYHDLMNVAFPDSWDPERKAYRTQSRLLGPLYALLGAPTTKTVTGDAIAAYLESRLKIDMPDDQPDIVTISMTSTDPKFAVGLLAAVHKEATEMLRVAAAKRADHMIGYLRGRLDTLTVQEYRQSLLMLMGMQENLRLLSQPGVSYAAEILDPPHASDFPTFPKPVPFLAVAAILGFVMGFIAIILLDAAGYVVRSPLKAFARRHTGGLPGNSALVRKKATSSDS